MDQSEARTGDDIKALEGRLYILLTVLMIGIMMIIMMMIKMMIMMIMMMRIMHYVNIQTFPNQ